MKRRILLFSILFIVILCTVFMSNNFAKAYFFVMMKGYTVISFDNKIPNYVLTETLLNSPPFKSYWKIQPINPKNYLNKTINTYKFVVRNHPFDKYFSDKNGDSKRRTVIFIMVCDNKIVGGYSLPSETYAGMDVYPLDGPSQ